MAEQLTGYEASSVDEIEAVLDDLPADAKEVYLRTIGYSERAIAAVAAKRAGVGGGGGYSGSPFTTGDATPVGSVTPSQVGALYGDTTHGALYVAIGVTSADWIQLGGVTGADASNGVTSLTSLDQTVIRVLADTTAGLSDPVAASDNGTGNGIYWHTQEGGDGTQVAYINVGPDGDFGHIWAADGSYTITSGLLDLPNMPTSDPHINGRLWSNGGAVMISAG